MNTLAKVGATSNNLWWALNSVDVLFLHAENTARRCARALLRHDSVTELVSRIFWDFEDSLNYSRLVDLDSSGSLGVRPAPGLTSSTQVVCVCVRVYTSTHTHTTLTPAKI